MSAEPPFPEGASKEIFLATVKGDVEELKQILEDHECDNDTDPINAFWIMRWAGFHQSLEMMQAALDKFAIAWAYILDAVFGAADSKEFNGEFIGTILWHFKEHLPVLGNTPVNDYRDIFVGRHMTELDRMKNMQVKDFVINYVFDEEARPVGRIVMPPESDIDQQAEEDDFDSAIFKFAKENNFGGLLTVIHLSNDKDIYNILWWCGFHANLQMLNFVIDHFKGTDKEVVVWRKIGHSVMQGMSRSDEFSKEVIIRAFDHKRSIAPNLKEAKPKEIYPPEFLDELAKAPNKKVYRLLEELNA